MRHLFQRGTAWLVLLFFMLLCPGFSSAAGAPAGSTPVLHAFYPSYITYSTAWEKYIDKLDSVSFAWSRLDGDDPATVNTVKGKNENDTFYFPEDALLPLQYARSKGKPVQLSIFADRFNAEKILTSKENRTQAVAAVIKALYYDGGNGSVFSFDGIVIDFEGLQDHDASGAEILSRGLAVSTYYNTFLKELKTALAPLGKKLYAAVNPRLNYDGYDYAAILQTADKVILMAHDYEPVGALRKNEASQYSDYSVAAPIDSLAPVSQVRRALDDIRKEAAASGNISKVWLQIAFDSAQWQFSASSLEAWETLDGGTMSLGGRDIPTYFKIKYRIDNGDGKGAGLSGSYNNELQSPCLQYFNTGEKTFNIILYEDRRSVEAKIKMARAFGLGGISLWSIGNIPDYTDLSGKRFHLDVWDGILATLKNWDGLLPKNTVPVKFSSRKVETAVRNKIGKPSGTLTNADTAQVYRLRLPQDTDSLKDLKYLVNLEYLEMQQTKIKDISPIGSLVNLKTLRLPNNRISDIRPLKKLTKLETLHLQRNAISNIQDLQGLKALREISLNGNQVGNLAALGKLTNLQWLYLKENSIKDVLPLKGLTKLRVLYLGGNPIRDFSPLKDISGALTASDFTI